MSIDKISHFVQSPHYEEMFFSGAKVNILRQLISEYQASLGLQRLEWAERNVVGKFIATKHYDLNNDQLYELLDSHGVLPKTVRIKWNSLNELEQHSLQENCLASKPYLKFTPKRINQEERDGGHISYRNDLVNYGIDGLLANWKQQKWIYSRLFDQWNALRVSALTEMLKTKQITISLSEGKLSVVIPDPCVDTNAAFQWGGTELLQRCGKIDMEQVKLLAAKGYYSMTEVQKHLKVVDVRTKYILLTLTSERNMMEGMIQQSNRYSWVNLRSQKGWEV
ncbi:MULTISPECIES: hypothetical protein [Paenibacillus]|uniref:Uncharacterized protein n=2 Tax=Paenibacillus TaxID=44249 RepID=A0A7Y6EVG3_9BACL|nr:MULTISPECIES: hypothetical protein [Paenibacillus]KGP81914.1 hypothetical protein P364_0113885 [Paenibacillus sp. MAEPY2]KGP87346.1 hypothetical protein P363_0112385 [Paenibacillus sp. MAEPY1]MDN4603826.1 hypothetical protein [Paenibacillus vandeheii]NUU75699.1 hypothetical protein [Paenibacillus xylanilyticus]